VDALWLPPHRAPPDDLQLNGVDAQWQGRNLLGENVLYHPLARLASPNDQLDATGGFCVRRSIHTSNG